MQSGHSFRHEQTMKPISSTRLVLWSAAWTALTGWVYLVLADGLPTMHVAKLALQLLCLVGLFFLAVKAVRSSWPEVIVKRPLLQAVGFLFGIAVALLVSGSALTSISAELNRLSGADLVVAIARPVIASLVLVFLPLSLLAFGVATWRKQRSSRDGATNV
jgi:hypothetical protein